MTSFKSISILLCAVVVLCPYQCIFHCYQSSCAVENVCMGHCDCSSQQSRDDEVPNSAPNLPCNCTCNDCFCCGAIPAHEVSEDLNTSEPLSWLAVWESSKSFVNIADQLESASFLVPECSSGQGMRAALSSWTL